MLRAANDRKYALTLLAVAATILAIGIILRAARTEVKKPPVDLERLQQLTEQRRLKDLSNYLLNSAGDVAQSLVYLDAKGTSGVVWGNPGSVLAPRRADVPFVIATPAAEAGLVPAYRATVMPATGEWVLAIAKNPDQQVIFAQGVYQGSVPAKCGPFAYDELLSSAQLSDALNGGGLFTIQGQLLGFITTCEGRRTVVAASSIADFLKKPLLDRVESDYGFRVDSGLQVTTVWSHSAAQAAGLQPGDVLQTVDGQEVHTPADLASLEPYSARAYWVEVQRGKRTVKSLLGEPPNEDAAVANAGVGLKLGPGKEAGRVVVLSVTKDSAAERAGILPGDELRRVGTAPVSDFEGAAGALDRLKGPTVLALARGGKELEVLLTP